jgi:hypothetical protein
MDKKLFGNFLQFYKAVDRILWGVWDPIGVNGCSEARDEYYTYLPQVYKLSLENNKKKLLKYLLWVEKDRMGLRGNEKNCKKTVCLIMETKKKVGL